jgi:ribose/xylose/arabinose/galactoside ABC-type transport system permease subunit
VGYVFGTLFGVLINGLIQVLIMFNGELSSWWTRIVIGALTLVFILVQSWIASYKKRQINVKSGAAPAAPLATAPDGVALPK